MVQRRAARFVKGRYGMYESVTQMLEELTWVPLSKRRENARLILFYKIINNLVQRPTLWIYLSLNWHIRHHADPSAIILVKESC